MEIDKRGKNAFKDINFFNKIIEENVCRLKKRTLLTYKKLIKHTQKRKENWTRKEISLCT